FVLEADGDVEIVGQLLQHLPHVADFHRRTSESMWSRNSIRPTRRNHDLILVRHFFRYQSDSYRKHDRSAAPLESDRLRWKRFSFHRERESASQARTRTRSRDYTARQSSGLLWQRPGKARIP